MGVRWAHWGVAQSLEPSPSHSKFAAFKYERKKKKSWQKRTNLKWRKKKCQASGYLKVICLCRIFNDLFGGLGKIVKRSFLVVPRRSSSFLDDSRHHSDHFTWASVRERAARGSEVSEGARGTSWFTLSGWRQRDDTVRAVCCQWATWNRRRRAISGWKAGNNRKKKLKTKHCFAPPSSKMSLKLNRHLLGPHQSVLVFIIIFFQIFVWSEKVWSIHVRKFTFTELFTERILKVPHSKIWKEKENTGYWI